MKERSRPPNSDRRKRGASPTRWRVKEQLEVVGSADLNDETEMTGLRAWRCDLSYCQAISVSIRECLFENVSLCGSLLKRVRMNEVQLEYCDFSNASLQEARLSKVRLSNCKLTGVNLNDARLSDVVVADSQGGLLHAFGAQFNNVLFERCVLKSADFRNCRFSQVTFKDCDLEGAEFYDAHFDAADLRGSYVRDIKAHAADLKGITLSKEQMLELTDFFAKLLAIDID